MAYYRNETLNYIPQRERLIQDSAEEAGNEVASAKMKGGGGEMKQGRLEALRE